MRKIAEMCDGKEVDLICSGYNPSILPKAWLAIISGLAGNKVQMKGPLSSAITEGRTLEMTKELIKEVKRNLHPYWETLIADTT